MNDFLTATVMFGQPPEKNTKVMQAFHKVKPKFSERPRLVNHFMLGADPEFVFSDDRGRRVDAAQMRLRTGLFVGADQNGRLVEIRPRPSRSALSVVASIMVSLRWLPILRPHTLDYSWLAGAWKFNDGLGGHIHFGRKRPTRAREVVALDAIAEVLYKQGVFPADEILARRGGDAHHQVYGMPSDFRPQVHGYEYRSLPSWLDSPWLAYLCIVLGKLAVAYPDLVTPWDEMQTPSVDTLKNLLAYFKAVDDDAAIALKALEVHGLPLHVGGDFKKRWGLCPTTLLRAMRTDIDILPTSVKPSSADKKQLFDWLVNGAALPCGVPPLSWEPYQVPQGFELLAETASLQGQVGLGELLWDVVLCPKVPMTVAGSSAIKQPTLTTGLVKLLPVNWAERMREIVPDARPQIVGEGHAKLSLPKSWRTAKRIQLTKQLLTSGLFPLWRVRDAKMELVKPWLRDKFKKQHAECVGKQLFPPPAKENG
jgi:hypothetical protein